jgi:sugar phosphate isomerase/epimerase
MKMRLGFLTNYSQERVLTAKVIGFSCLELQAASLPLGNDAALAQVHETCLQNNIGVAAIACYQNHLEAGNEAERLKTFRQAIEAAPKLNCKVVATMGGCTQESKDTGDITKSIPAFKKYFTQAAKIAEDNGVKIAFENWPGGHPAPLLINIAFCPQAWEAMFDAVPSPALGLEYDPSHLVRLDIDYLPLIARYADRIHHVHAKDTTIKTEILNEVGYIGQGWWHYSIPSLGVVEWDALFEQLKGIGYQGDVNIEHEDPNYQGHRFDDGLRIGHHFLTQFTHD